MPQSTQHSLLCILLVWTTIISIIQAVFIIIMFTQGHHGLVKPPQNNNDTAMMPLKHSGIHIPPSPPPQDRLCSGCGKMITFKATGGDNVNAIKWLSEDPVESLISEKGTTLTIMRGGYYFLNLHVTLVEPNARCNITLRQDDETILEGVNSTSPVLLSKVAKLSTGERLQVNILPDFNDVNQTKSVTHLDIIYLPIQ